MSILPEYFDGLQVRGVVGVVTNAEEFLPQSTGGFAQAQYYEKHKDQNMIAIK